MIDAIVTKLIDKLLILLNATRTQRREFLVDEMNGIFNDLENINKNYLESFSRNFNDYKNHKSSLNEVLLNLSNDRYEKLSERDKVITICEKIIVKKWNREVKAFLEQVYNYFIWNNEKVIFNDKLYYIINIRDVPSEILKEFIEARKRFGYSTGFTGLQHILIKSNSVELSESLKMVIGDSLNELNDIEKKMVLKEMNIGNKEDNVIDCFNISIENLRFKWKNVVEAYTELAVKSKSASK